VVIMMYMCVYGNVHVLLPCVLCCVAFTRLCYMP
jgi:hypothetical protein